MENVSQTAPVEAVEVHSTDPAITQSPVPAEPENPDGELAPQKTELSPAEKEARALKRRVDRLTSEKYQAQAELNQYRQRQPEPQADPQHTPTQQDVQRQAREFVEQERFNAKCNDVAAVGQKKFPDFFAKLTELQAELPIADGNGRPLPLMEALMDADDPAGLIHHLGSNPDLAAELAGLTPRQQVRKLALIERDMAGKDTPPKPSNAPKPLQPVRATAAGVGPDPSKDPEAWIAWRNAQVRSK